MEQSVIEKRIANLRALSKDKNMCDEWTPPDGWEMDQVIWMLNEAAQLLENMHKVK